MKKLFFAMAAIAMLAACESEGNGNKKPVGPGEFTQAETKVTVDVTAAGWENCNAWAWNLEDTTINYTTDAEGNATWPGVALETEEIDGKTYYVWTAAKELEGSTIGFIVSGAAGETSGQTIDLHITLDSGKGVAIVLTETNADGKWLATINGETAEEPEQEPVEEPVVELADHTWGVIGGFNSWGADVPMTITDGVASATFEITAVEDGGNEFKVRADADWAVSYGYNPAEGEPELAPVDGSEFFATFNGNNIKVTEVGSYTITFAIDGEIETFTLKKN